MAWWELQLTHKSKVKGDRGWIKEEGPYPSNTQPKKETRYREWKPNDSSTPQRVKQAEERVVGLDKPTGNGKHMNTRQEMDLYRSRARIRLRHHPLVPSQYKGGGPWVRGKRGYGLAVGRSRKPILGFSLKFFWGKCPAGMTYHPKEAKMSWNH